MARSGIEIGSHTVSHPNLTQLSDAALDFELRESRRVIEEHLERDVATLAYPIGTASAFDERVVQHARQAGYRLAVTYRIGANWIGSLRRYELRRHGVGPWMSTGFFAAMMALPDWVHE
jgi:peptidoglycan/xylan/chitin deacetylase (PgdA/CDA1 family)